MPRCRCSLVLQTASSLTVGDSAPSSVRLIGGALAKKNVYWYVGDFVD
jgi:hypothetical protein